MDQRGRAVMSKGEDVARLLLAAVSSSTMFKWVSPLIISFVDLAVVAIFLKLNIRGGSWWEDIMLWPKLR
jgi:hypothetical protein